jgi:hypothetical protein
MPPDLDSEIETAAIRDGMTYSAWLAAVARKEFTIRAGLDAVAAFERERGAFSESELADARHWVTTTVDRGARTGARRRRGA